MTIRIVVVDDEPLAREGVVFQLRNEKDVEIVAECEDGNAAISAIRTLKPDLVYLDIKMPKLSGFDVISAVGVDNMPLVIFLTAYDEHAVEAFRLNALDYLLKPIEKARFHDSLRKARAQLFKNRLSAHSSSLTSLLAELGHAPMPAEKTESRDTPLRIAVRLTGQIQFLRPDEINWIESEGDYVSVHTAQRSHLVRETMAAMEKRLNAYGFQRIHRSAIVNLEKVRGLIVSDAGDYEVQLLDNSRLKIGRNFRDALYARMKIEN
ncbi:MAG: LytTR family DNA-binding domain-containing protein [Pseudomonadota bacterium]